jgi:hypothetical protein
MLAVEMKSINTRNNTLEKTMAKLLIGILFRKILVSWLSSILIIFVNGKDVTKNGIKK